MVMIDGALYLDAGKENDVTVRCGVMDGEITSSMTAKETPSQNGQSNFGAGYSYQYVDENSIDIFMNDECFRFEKETPD